MRKVLKKFEKSEEHAKRKPFFKNHCLNFYRLKIKFDRSKNSFGWSSINWAPIEPGRFKPKILSHFRSIEQQFWLVENLENSNFWKIEQFNAETPQSTLFKKKKGAWVWDKKFFKNTWIQPRSSKIKIFKQIVLKNSNIKHICIKIKEL